MRQSFSHTKRLSVALGLPSVTFTVSFIAVAASIRVYGFIFGPALFGFSILNCAAIATSINVLTQRASLIFPLSTLFGASFALGTYSLPSAYLHGISGFTQDFSNGFAWAVALLLGLVMAFKIYGLSLVARSLLYSQPRSLNETNQHPS